LISAGAFGGTHAPPAALINTLSVLPAGAPVAVTIDERWMDRSDPDGFGAVVERLVECGELVLMERERFQHRVTTTGEPIFYELVIARTRRSTIPIDYAGPRPGPPRDARGSSAR
jgi:hypothetical protein